jgi:hypothetical protein
MSTDQLDTLKRLYVVDQTQPDLGSQHQTCVICVSIQSTVANIGKSFLHNCEVFFIKARARVGGGSVSPAVLCFPVPS